MFEIKKIVTKPNCLLNYIMPCPITALTSSAIKKTMEKKTNNRISKNKNFGAKTQYLNLKAPSNNVKKQSDKTLASQRYNFLTIKQMKNSKTDQHFLNQIISKVLRIISL